MKKNILSAVMLGLLCIGPLQAQELFLNPMPQEYTINQDGIDIPAQYRVLADDNDALSPAIGLLERVMPGENEEASFRVCIGIKGDKNIKKYARHIPAKAEGYYLKIDKRGITIAANDARGAYYGVQTLAQLLALPQLPLIEITDYPDIPYRGVVEGFYGTPWSHEARLSQLDFYGRNKMNTYIYGPKDDPYHRTPHWRKPYPEKEAAQLRELVEKAKENNVIFYWAIHPGQDIKWNEEDRKNLLDKFESMYQLGVRGFAVFFDDISGEGTQADKQAELLNYLDDYFVKVKGDVAPLILCPTEYNKAWSNVEGGYLTTLGNKLNAGIQIMWTGDDVVANIDHPTFEFINPLIKRKAYIWWNYPVSDFVQDHLLMGAVYGNATDIKDDAIAFVSNPMEHAEASKIALYGIAAYTWNMDDYDPQQVWEKAICDLMPAHAPYLRTFAIHNADLGPNRYNFRRDESENIRPALEILLQSYKEGKMPDEKTFRQVEKECHDICTTSDRLLTADENPMLINEIAPWLIRFKVLGMFGKEVLNVLQKQDLGQTKEACQAYLQAQAWHSYLQWTDKLLNQQAQQPGAECGSKVLLPALEALFEVAASRQEKIE